MLFWRKWLTHVYLMTRELTKWPRLFFWQHDFPHGSIQAHLHEYQSMPVRRTSTYERTKIIFIFSRQSSKYKVHLIHYENKYFQCWSIIQIHKSSPQAHNIPHFMYFNNIPSKCQFPAKWRWRRYNHMTEFH
jgi:hypothetical protein